MWLLGQPSFANQIAYRSAYSGHGDARVLTYAGNAASEASTLAKENRVHGSEFIDRTFAAKLHRHRLQEDAC